MPVTRITCPHCESSVELQVSGVTRSRACPNCGEMVILQVAEKEQKVKRRALLMEQNVVAPDEPVEEYSPQPIQGDVLERMKMDPELLTFRKRLITGTFVLGLLIAAAVAYHFVPEKPKPFVVKPVIESPPTEDAKAESAPPAAAKPPPEVTPILPPAVEALKKQEEAAAASADAPPMPKDLKLIGVDDPAPTLTPPSTAGVVSQADSAAAEVLGQFLRAKTVEERLAVSANAAGLGRIMANYYAMPEHPSGEISFKEIKAVPDAVGKGTVEFAVVLADGSVRNATVKEEKEGLRVDWPSFVLWSGMSSEKFRAAKPTRPVEFRVTVIAAEEYSGDFADGRWLQCLQLQIAAEPEAAPLFAYVERKSRLGSEVAYWLQFSDSKPMPMTVRLRFPPDARTDNQVWLDKISCTGWVSPVAQQ